LFLEQLSPSSVKNALGTYMYGLITLITGVVGYLLILQCFRGVAFQLYRVCSKYYPLPNTEQMYYCHTAILCGPEGF
jgi:hypothetical protein